MVSVFKLFLSLSLLWIQGFYLQVDGYIANIENRLREVLFQRSHSDALPVARRDQTLVVNFGIDFLHIVQLDEREQTLIVKCIVRMEWQDVGLKWNVSEFGGVNTVSVNPQWIWTPDIALYTSTIGEEAVLSGPGFAKVRSTGKVTWEPPVTIRQHCPVELWHYPHDEHTCTLKIGSWTSDGNIINFNLDMKGQREELMDKRLFQFNVWNIEITEGVKETIHYPCCPEPYVSILYKIHLERRPSFIHATILTPMVAILLLGNALFWLPGGAAEKGTLSGFTCLLILILILHLVWALPRNGNSVPAIVGVCATMFFFSALSFVVAMVTINLSSKQTPPPIPTGRFASLLRLRQHSDSTCEDEAPWSSVVKFVDRICFFVYFILSIILIAILYS